jgi:hypothetical protein
MEKAKYKKYASWNIKGITHKEEELDSILYEKQIKIVAITERKMKLRGRMETNYYIVTYSGLNEVNEHKWM